MKTKLSTIFYLITELFFVASAALMGCLLGYLIFTLIKPLL